MATTAAPSTVTRAALTVRNSAATQKRSTPKVVSIGGLNSSYQRLSSGPVCGDQGYVNVVYTSRRGRKGKSGGGSGLSAKCSRVGEIFQIAAIMNALTLVGVAMGFVLLRIEAAVEEAE
ncbi:Cytochrome b6-f complex subunit 7 (Fragment) [Linum grandiflorum]